MIFSTDFSLNCSSLPFDYGFFAEKLNQFLKKNKKSPTAAPSAQIYRTSFLNVSFQRAVARPRIVQAVMDLETSPPQSTTP